MEKDLSGKDLWDQVISNVVPKETLELSSYYNYQIRYNIRHLLFSFARYKFAARMLGDSPKKTVLELGCNEGIGTLHLAQVAEETLGVDFDENAVKWASDNLAGPHLRFIGADFMNKEFGKFDAVVTIDVIEHLEKEKEDLFLETIIQNLNDEGFAIIGTPNITSLPYASEASRIGHINLYDHQRLKDLLLKRFKNVFLFGMNDEVIHTGFSPMCHFLFALACNKR